ncbi:hypothetical protein F5Y03DRAFT_74711 [Xylaria venustula]|nr:hypothetical protein F5Y03DRAFT_74711 [Xylaria venustula]
MSLSATEIDQVHNIILAFYLVFFLFTRANQIRYLARAMADTMVPQTPPKKLFKPSSKTLTPTRSRPSPQSAQQPQNGSAQKTPRDAQQSATSPEPTLDSVVKSTNLAPLTNSSVASERSSEHLGSDTTETPTGLVDNYILTPTDTASRSTDGRPPLSRDVSQNLQRSSSFKDKIARARESARETTDGLAKTLGGTVSGATSGKSTEASESAEEEKPPYDMNSPADIAKYFKDQGNPEMSNFVTSLIGDQSSGSNEDTPRPAKSPANETQSQHDQTDQTTKNKKDQSTSEETTPDNKPEAEPANVSKTADGTFRDTEDAESEVQSNSKIGEPNVSRISQTAHPAVPSKTSDGKGQSDKPQHDGQDKGAHVVDNMGRPTHVERTIEIPFQRPQKTVNGVQKPNSQGTRANTNDLGDFEDLPKVENLPSTDDLPDIPEDSPDPPEEVLDPSVHSTASSNITPIPKIPKIGHIDSSPPVNLQRLAQGLAGHAIDDVGNIVDESGEVLGHATGDLPAMVGKKVSDSGEIYSDDGDIVGYVSDNFVNPPSPTEIPGDVLGGLKVDHKGNILDSEGNIIGKFHQPPGKKSSSQKPSAKSETEEKSKEERKPKVNAQTGGSPSDLFLDVKSTTDGIQLTIRIPTTFSQPPPES